METASGAVMKAFYAKLDGAGLDTYSNYVPDKLDDTVAVIQVVDNALATWRADRDSGSLRVRVCALSEAPGEVERVAQQIEDLLHLSGSGDSRRSGTALTSQPDWDIISVNKVRQIRLVPNNDWGMKYFECGWIFSVYCEAKQEYA